MSQYGRNQYKIVKQLSSHKIQILKKMIFLEENKINM